MVAADPWPVGAADGEGKCLGFLKRVWPLCGLIAMMGGPFKKSIGKCQAFEIGSIRYFVYVVQKMVCF